MYVHPYTSQFYCKRGVLDGIQHVYYICFCQKANQSFSNSQFSTLNLIVSLVFSHLGFWSVSLFLIAPFPDLCLLVPFDFGSKFPRANYPWFKMEQSRNTFSHSGPWPKVLFCKLVHVSAFFNDSGCRKNLNAS